MILTKKSLRHHFSRITNSSGDGNKRTGMVSCGVFLLINNCMLDVPEVELVTHAINLENNIITEEDFALWLTDNKH